jgi:hypothetical protein
MSTTSLPPTLAEASKFNGSNWVAWKGLITITASLRGISGYLDGSIPKPLQTPQNVPLPASPTATTPAITSTTSISTTHSESAWESITPSSAEWKVCNAWAMGLLVYNTMDPIGLGINISGTAADAWKSYLHTYEVASEIAIINAN